MHPWYSSGTKLVKIDFKAVLREIVLKPARVKESDLLRAVLRWLALHDVYHWRVPVGPVVHQLGSGSNVRSFWKASPLKGFPDICGVLRRKNKGVMFAIELKSPSGRIRPDQARWIVDLQKAGCAVVIARSVEEVEAMMLKWGEIGSVL